MAKVDSLEIQIKASADKANVALDSLIDKLNKVNAALNGANNNKGLTNMANSIKNMNKAMQGMSKSSNSGNKAINNVGKSLNLFGNNAVKASRKSFNLASAIGKVYATYWMLFRAMRGIGKSIDYASQIQEVQNVVDNTFGVYIGRLDAITKDSITQLGMSELTVKKIASTYQAMGKAMGFAQGDMADMSVSLTQLTADMASFYDVSQKDVAEDLQSIFTGMAKPLRQYGLDLTEKTLKEYALANGMDANIQKMSQMEKAMLRYRYVMDNTKVAQGDFAKTSSTWANQIRILKENFVQLGNVIGRTFIAALKPMVTALNSIMQVIIRFAELVSNALGKIFGWKFENPSGGSLTDDFENAEDAADGLADNTGKAANNAKKLKQQLQGIDELNVLHTNDSGSGGGGGGGSTTGGNGNQEAWTTTETIFDYFQSNIKDLESLGSTIRDSLIKAMESIKWEDVYEKARNFGSGLASFLNGLFSADKNGNTVFGELGKTIAGSLNTALSFLNTFFKDFDFKQFGKSLSSGVNNFFKNFDWELAAETINSLIDGLKEALKGVFEDLSWEDILSGPLKFVDELELDTTVLLTIGAVKLLWKGEKLLLSALSSILSSEVAVGIGTLTIPLSAAIGITIVVAIIGYKIGKTLYERVPTVQEWADSLVELAGGIFTGEYSIGEVVNATFDMELDLVAKVINFFDKDGKTKITGDTLKNAWLSVFKAGKFVIDTAFELVTDPAKFYNDKIKPFIDLVKSKIKNISIDLGISDKLDKIKKAWNKWNPKKKTLSLAQSGFDKIKSGLEKIKSLWDKIVGGTKKINIAFTDTFTAPLRKAWNALANKINSLIPTINKIPGVNITNKVPTFANGGFPRTSDIFYANENGVPELVGTLGGRTAVASGTEITGISDAIYDTNSQQIAMQQRQIDLLTQIVAKEFGISQNELFQSVRSSATDYQRRNGTPAFI